jgi:uncharacterized protein (TIRG00374 family)
VLLVAALLLSDPQHVYEELSGVDLLWLIPCFGVACVQLVLLGLRWSKVSRALGVELNVVRATIEYTLSVALNLLLPSGLAGDGFRAYRHHRLVPGPGVLRIVEALALDRVSGQLALGLVVLVGIPLGVTHEVLELSSLAIFAVAGAVLVLGGAWLSRRVRRLGEITASLARLSSRALRVLFTPRSLVWHLPLSLLFTAASVTQLFIASRALGVSMSLTELFWAGPLILLAASLPSFFGGWGVREGASGLVFAALGHAPGTGVAISVVYGVFGLIVHLPGLLVLVIDSNPAATAAPAQSEGNR